MHVHATNIYNNCFHSIAFLGDARRTTGTFEVPSRRSPQQLKKMAQHRFDTTAYGFQTPNIWKQVPSHSSQGPTPPAPHRHKLTISKDVLPLSPRSLRPQNLSHDPCLRLPTLHDPPCKSSHELRVRRLRPPRQFPQDGKQSRR